MEQGTNPPYRQFRLAIRTVAAQSAVWNGKTRESTSFTNVRLDSDERQFRLSLGALSSSWKRGKKRIKL